MPGSPDSDNGNLTSKTDGTDTYDYLWDDLNRLIGVELNSTPVVTYEYDSKSRLLQRIEGGTTTNYHWKGWDLIREEKTGAVTETTNYLVPAGAFERGGNWFYMHGDALSSTQLVTDENGAQVGRFIYGAWGEELYASESVPGVLENRFVGGLGCRRDAATGLIYMRMRWYDPALMRFISRDPIGMKGGTNFYKYAGNNPVNMVDPVGLTSSPVSSSLPGGTYIYPTTSIELSDAGTYDVELTGVCSCPPGTKALTDRMGQIQVSETYPLSNRGLIDLARRDLPPTEGVLDGVLSEVGGSPPAQGFLHRPIVVGGGAGAARAFQIKANCICVSCDGESVEADFIQTQRPNRPGYEPYRRPDEQ